MADEAEVPETTEAGSTPVAAVAEGEVKQNLAEKAQAYMEHREEEAAPPEIDEETERFLKPFRGKDGKVDEKKFTKSYVEAQKLIGKTSKDREMLKKLPEYEKAYQTLVQVDGFIKSDPRLQAEWQQAVDRKSGKTTPVAQEPQAKEDTKKKLSELMAKGEYEEVVSTVLNSRPELQRVQAVEQQLRDARAQIEQERAQKEAAAEFAEFKRNHVRDGIYDENGELKDAELRDEMQRIYDEPAYKLIPMEDVCLVAKRRLGRTASEARVNQDKQRATKNPSRSKTPAPADDGESFLGLTREQFKRIGKV